MNYLVIAAVAFVSAAIGAMLVDWRFWRSFIDEVRRHGLDNHLCQKVGCCR
jgi:hypothetical protein